jgi:hypothetical protein
MKYCVANRIYNLSGLSRLESIAASLASRGNPIAKWRQSYGYHTPAKMSFKRFFNKNPVDWTGGTWADRVDYNRTRMQDVFLSSDSNAFCHAKNFTKFAGDHRGGEFDLGEAGKLWRNIIDHYMTNESDPVDEPYYWATTSGKTNRV